MECIAEIILVSVVSWQNAAGRKKNDNKRAERNFIRSGLRLNINPKIQNNDV